MARSRRIRGRAAGPPSRRQDPSAPKGRPTPGRKQRNAAARTRERRHRLVVRLWWAGAILVFLTVLVVLVVTGIGAGTGAGHGLR